MADSPALRGVITDWGGVLTSPIPDTVRAWITAEGIDWDGYLAVMRPWVFGAYNGDTEPNPVHALERGECTAAEFEALLASRLVRLDGGPVSSDRLLARMFAASATVPAMYQLVRSLRGAGYRTGLLSNSWGLDDYRYADFPGLFDAVVISGDIGMRKPEPEIFYHAAAAVGLAPHECVFIDDVEANIAAATACGMTGILHVAPDATTAVLSALLGITLR